MIKYLKQNPLAGLKTSPAHHVKLSVFLLLLFVLSAFIIGGRGDLFKIKILNSRLKYILPVTLFIFPSLLEESFFRGILIPNNIKDKGLKAIIIATLISALLFTLWHPFNALTINPTAKELFLNPYFLTIVFCLGIVCSITYIFSKSLWQPVIIHWITVLIWVIFLSGRNYILE